MSRVEILAVLVGALQLTVSAGLATAREWTEAELSETELSIPRFEFPRVKERLHREHEARIRALLNAKTLFALSRLVGAAPDRCQSAGRTLEVCSWEVHNKLPGYDLLAKLVRTTKRVFMVCELPSDNSERVLGSCTLNAPE